MKTTTLFDYWRSSASYRVRIALHLLNIEFQSVSIDLVAGEQRSEAHIKRNPQGFVPVLDIDELTLTQSAAIIEYLNETRNADFLPKEADKRARVRALSYVIAMETHPICNTSIAADVVQVSGKQGEAANAVRNHWMQRHIRRGLIAFEKLLDHPAANKFCHGDRPGLADICLIPQIYNARRWGAKIDDLDRILEIAENCEALEAFQQAHPDRYKPV